MGLGKTLQTLAFLRHVREREPGLSPALVVCPTSLVFNWLAEAKKFTPSMRVLALQGPERAGLFGEISKVDLVVTSYALIRRDAERYRGLEFDTVILDEAQHIKNRQTQNAQAVKAIRAKHRLVLTGTPLENSVLDLWSIFDFFMPGYLGSAQDFRNDTKLPITRDKNVEAQKRLARRLQPFLLRRLKRMSRQICRPRSSKLPFANSTAEQRAVYQQVIEASAEGNPGCRRRTGPAKSRMVVSERAAPPAADLLRPSSAEPRRRARRQVRPARLTCSANCWRKSSTAVTGFWCSANLFRC